MNTSGEERGFHWWALWSLRKTRVFKATNSDSSERLPVAC